MLGDIIIFCLVGFIVLCCLMSAVEPFMGKSDGKGSDKEAGVPVEKRHDAKAAECSTESGDRGDVFIP